MNIEYPPVIRYCGFAKIRIRFTRFDNRGVPRYSGAISFPNGKRWPFRDIGPAPAHLTNGDADAKEAYDVAAGEACAFCGYMGDNVHRNDLSDAMWGDGDYISNDHGTIYRIKRSPKGKTVARINA